MNAPDSVVYMGMALAVYVVIELLAIFFKWLW
jgi:preprotein translocase subunit Sec61beta